MSKILVFVIAVINFECARALALDITTIHPVFVVLCSVLFFNALTLALAVLGTPEWQARFPVKAALWGTLLVGQLPWVGISLRGNLGNGAGGVELVIGAFFAAISLTALRSINKVTKEDAKRLSAPLESLPTS